MLCSFDFSNSFITLYLQQICKLADTEGIVEEARNRIFNSRMLLSFPKISVHKGARRMSLVGWDEQ